MMMVMLSSSHIPSLESITNCSIGLVILIMTMPQQWLLWWWWQMQLCSLIKTCSPVQLLFDLSITILSVLTMWRQWRWSTMLTKMEKITWLEATTTTMVDDDLSQGGAAAPDAKVARRKMTGLSNKVRPYHHGLGHPPSPHRHLHCPCCLLHGYIIRYSKSWLWTFMTRWIGGKQTPSGTRLRYFKNSYWCHQLQ